jgi:hypothetical protein
LVNEINPSQLLLMREGDPAPGCDGCTIDTILQTEIDPESGSCFILASLKGASPADNLALFSARLFDAVLARHQLRRPNLEMRKGSFVRGSFGTTSRITSIAFGTRSADASGASEKGLPSAVSDGHRAGMLLKYSDGKTHAVLLHP